MKNLSLLALAGLVAASPCPYGQMAEGGHLSKKEADNFYAARANGEALAGGEIDAATHAKREAEHHAQAEFYKRQVEASDLPLGGGLLNGKLQPFTGELKLLELPTPQEFSLKLIPDAAHPYVAPTKEDLRGMCPTMNTMANHGYINRNGITTFAQAADACQITLGFGYDTCVFLAAVGLLAGGDLPTGIMSIGGFSSKVPNTLGPSLGMSQHGFFEVDNSISREDSYFGNQADFQLERWDSLVAITKKYGGQFGLETFGEERVLRYQQSKANNPDFDAGVRWLAVTTAERVFIPRALPNGTDLNNANYANVAPFYLNETFPENWFRRPTAYSLADTGVDIVTLLANSPEVTTPGQNEGLGNFVPAGIDLSNVTPSDATCYLATSVFDETPGFLSPALVDNYKIVQAFLNGAVKPFFASYDCPITQFGKPTKKESTDGKGPSVDEACHQLVNGKYTCKDVAVGE